MRMYTGIWFAMCMVVSMVSSQKKPDANAPKVRKDIYTLSLLELEQYVTALNTVFINDTAAVQSLTSEYVSKLEPLQKDTSSNRLDNTNYYYLDRFEKLLIKVNPDVRVHYWNWTKYAEFPQLDPVFSRTLFGMKVDDKGCLTEGNFYKAELSKGECIKRTLPTPYANLNKLPQLATDRVYRSARSRLRTMTTGVASKFTGYANKAQLPRDPLYYSLISYELQLLYSWGEAHGEDIEAKEDTYKISNKKDYKIESEKD